jgi:hypothetical protein
MSSVERKWYAFSRGKFYDLYLNDGSNTERSQGIIRFKPYFRSSHVSPTDVECGFRFHSHPISGIRGDVEVIPRALEAAGLSGESLESMFTGLRLPFISEYPSIERMLERGEQETRRILTSVCVLARERNLDWAWVEKHCTETENTLIEPLDRHFLFLKLTHMDSSYAVSQQTPITIRPTPEISALLTRPSFSGHDLGLSQCEEWLELYPVIRKTRTDPNGSSILHVSVAAITHRHSRTPWAPQCAGRTAYSRELLMRNHGPGQVTAKDEYETVLSLLATATEGMP